MHEIARYYLILTAVCIGLVLPGIARAEAPMQARVYMSCAYHAELTFYIAQEKVYNAGNVDKLLEYAKANLEPTFYEITKAQYARLGKWVDAHDFDTAKHYARSLFYECLEANYPENFQPDETDKVYIYRFEQHLESVPEELYPHELNGKEIEA